MTAVKCDCGREFVNSHALAGHRSKSGHIITEHGTYAMYQRELRNGEPICQPCQDARNVQAREWRHRTGDKNGRRYMAARTRALTRLRRKYPAAYQRLLVEELSIRGTKGER